MEAVVTLCVYSSNKKKYVELPLPHENFHLNENNFYFFFIQFIHVRDEWIRYDSSDMLPSITFFSIGDSLSLEINLSIQYLKEFIENVNYQLFGDWGFPRRGKLNW